MNSNQAENLENKQPVKLEISTESNKYNTFLNEISIPYITEELRQSWTGDGALNLKESLSKSMKIEDNEKPMVTFADNPETGIGFSVYNSIQDGFQFHTSTSVGPTSMSNFGFNTQFDINASNNIPLTNSFIFSNSIGKRKADSEVATFHEKEMDIRSSTNKQTDLNMSIPLNNSGFDYNLSDIPDSLDRSLREAPQQPSRQLPVFPSSYVSKTTKEISPVFPSEVNMSMIPDHPAEDLPPLPFYSGISMQDSIRASVSAPSTQQPSSQPLQVKESLMLPLSNSHTNQEETENALGVSSPIPPPSIPSQSQQQQQQQPFSSLSFTDYSHPNNNNMSQQSQSMNIALPQSQQSQSQPLNIALPHSQQSQSQSQSQQSQPLNIALPHSQQSQPLNIALPHSQQQSNISYPQQQPNISYPQQQPSYSHPSYPVYPPQQPQQHSYTQQSTQSFPVYPPQPRQSPPPAVPSSLPSYYQQTISTLPPQSGSLSIPSISASDMANHVNSMYSDSIPPQPLFVSTQEHIPPKPVYLQSNPSSLHQDSYYNPSAVNSITSQQSFNPTIEFSNKSYYSIPSFQGPEQTLVEPYFSPNQQPYLSTSGMNQQSPHSVGSASPHSHYSPSPNSVGSVSPDGMMSPSSMGSPRSRNIMEGKKKKHYIAKLPSGDKIESIVVDMKNPKKVKKWTPEEDALLLEAVRIEGIPNWAAIAKHVPGRNNTQCCQRYNKVIKPGIKKGSWSKEEDVLLLQAVERFGENNWEDVAKCIPGRHAQKCKERYTHYIGPHCKKGNWTPEEDELILYLQRQWGNSWAAIAQQLPGRPANDVRTRFKTLTNKRRQATIVY